jgi:hypothetical protein
METMMRLHKPTLALLQELDTFKHVAVVLASGDDAGADWALALAEQPTPAEDQIVAELARNAEWLPLAIELSESLTDWKDKRNSRPFPY